MATQAQIRRIAQRIEELMPRTSKPFVAIRVGLDESKAEAEARHYRERPQDRGASEVLFIQRVIVDPPKW